MPKAKSTKPADKPKGDETPLVDQAVIGDMTFDEVAAICGTTLTLEEVESDWLKELLSDMLGRARVMCDYLREVDEAEDSEPASDSPVDAKPFETVAVPKENFDRLVVSASLARQSATMAALIADPPMPRDAQRAYRRKAISDRARARENGSDNS